ncbi:pre-RNA processing PIH1/Nop17-domain-containing protein [Mycena crocata]|nr:pre-RNA processing PIH1/Nop17-domain-containing protein [Mycena crocata]
MSRQPVDLNPTPGFCLKSTTAQASVLKLAPSPRPDPNSLEPQRTSLAVPKGLKVFINIAWDANVPPPPKGNEEAIQRAMRGEDTDRPTPDAWFVPVVVSEAKQDKDKAGNPSLVFDCIYHSSIRSRTVRDATFKAFIQGASRIEAQSALVLSRQISTPNIASKGKLLPRTVLIPSSFLPPSSTPKKPLIEEVPPSDVAHNANESRPAKGILKPSPITPPTATAPPTNPTWSWSKSASGSIEIAIVIPLLTRELVAQTTLDLEERRLVVCVPARPPLDIDFGMSDAEIVARSGGAHDAALRLKRERALDVDRATAEWRVEDGVLRIIA